MTQAFTVGELGMRAARGDAVRIVSRLGRELTEIVGEVTDHTEIVGNLAGRSHSRRDTGLTVWVDAESVRSWTGNQGRSDASSANWFYHGPYEWGDVGVRTGVPSKYQVYVEYEGDGRTRAVPLGMVEELETGAVVSHTVPSGKTTPDQQTSLLQFAEVSGR